MNSVNITEHENAKLNEKYYDIDHPSGLKISVLSKKFSNTVAMLTVRFGSGDRSYYDNSGDHFKLPAGTAHFLEHKMFETESGEDVFYIFSTYGANANAFTSTDITSYYFSCTDNFASSLGILLDFVLKPNFTEQSVEKEKDIIGQEIRSGEDSPRNRIYYELLRAMYASPEICDAVCGTEESVSEITRDLLLNCHGHFYRPGNMILTVCGDVSADEVAAVVDKHFDICSSLSTSKSFGTEYRIEYQDNPERRSLEMDVSRPLFAFGVRDNITALNERERLKRKIAIKLMLDVAFGHSGEFFSRLYEDAILTNNFSADYERLLDQAFVIVTGAADDPKKVYALFCKKIKDLQENGITKSDFMRMKRVAYADFVTGFDSADMIAEDLIDCAVTGCGLFDIYDILLELELDYVLRVTKEIFDTDAIAFVTVVPSTFDLEK